MAKKIAKNTNFRIGLTRQELIEAAQEYGKSEKSAKKSNTKNLEQYVIRQIAGKGIKVPDFSEREMKDIKKSASTWGVKDALKILTYRMEKIAGQRDEENYLRLTTSRNFEGFYDGQITPDMIDEIISRLPLLASTQVDSDMMRVTPYYANLYEDYAQEIMEREEKEREKANNSDVA